MATKTILVRDPLYGRIELPAFLEPFLASPEFARLAGVRLLNFESFELAALSEVRRRSHTLGVLHLGSRLALVHFGPQEMRALLIAAVLHDVGTPPFGHTLEYEFMRRTNQNHEAIITSILDGKQHPLGLDHQIHAGKVPVLPSLVAESGVEELVRKILLNQHPLSQCLFGDFDLDNLDNVFRMGWYLGEPCDGAAAIRLASQLDIAPDGRKLLRKQHRPLVETWLALRARTYDIILNSHRHRRNQAIFSRIVFEAMDTLSNNQDQIDFSDWFSTDEALFLRLKKMERLKPYFSDLDRSSTLPTATLEFICGERIDRSLLMRHRDTLAQELTHVTSERVYLSFQAIGETLERKVSFVDPGDEQIWSVGAPKLTYRLETHIGGSLGTADATSAKRVVSRKLQEYAYRHGWIAGIGEEPAPAEQRILEF